MHIADLPVSCRMLRPRTNLRQLADVVRGIAVASAAKEEAGRIIEARGRPEQLGDAPC